MRRKRVYGVEGIRSSTSLARSKLADSIPNFSVRTHPVEILEEWIAKQAKYNLFLAKHLPQIEITFTDVKPKKTQGEYEVTVKFTNTGYLPTAFAAGATGKDSAARPCAARIR